MKKGKNFGKPIKDLIEETSESNLSSGKELDKSKASQKNIAPFQKREDSFSNSSSDEESEFLTTPNEESKVSVKTSTSKLSL
jgi:hypothetical protein